MANLEHPKLSLFTSVLEPLTEFRSESAGLSGAKRWLLGWHALDVLEGDNVLVA